MDAAATEPAGRFVVDDTAFIESHLGDSDRGFTLVAEDDERLVAVLMVRFPASDGDNLARDIGLDEVVAQRAAHIESVAVLPTHRGRGLHRRLLAAAEEALVVRGTPVALATVAPDNAPSLANFTAAGYVERARRQKYGGLERLVVAKDLERR